MRYYIIVLLAALVSFSLSGCEKLTEEGTANWEIPPGLKDCRVYYLTSSTGSKMNIVRCPLSDTSAQYSCGKTQCQTHTVEAPIVEKPLEKITPETVTVDGVTYVKAK